MRSGSNPMPPSIFIRTVLSSRHRAAAAPVTQSSLFFAPQEAFQLGGDLVTRRHFIHAHGVALGGVDALLELAHHLLVLAAPGDQLVDLAARAVGRPAQSG